MKSLVEFQPFQTFWSPERDDLEDRIADISRKLFGSTKDHCLEFLPDDGSADEFATEEESEEYELHYKVLDAPFESQLAFWSAIGWDVQSIEGGKHPLLDEFSHQIIAAAKGLHGHLPGEAPSELDVQGLAERLEEEATSFLLRRRG